MRYLHFAPRPEDAALVARAFRSEAGRPGDFAWSLEVAVDPRR